HLDIAPDRELFHREERARAFRHHARSGDADEVEMLPAALERADERRTQLVAGRLARHEADGEALQRRMPRVEVARKSRSAFTSGDSAAWGTSWLRASASERPAL